LIEEEIDPLNVKTILAVLIFVIIPANAPAQTRLAQRKLNASEREFQKWVDGRTFPLWLSEETAKAMPRIEALLSSKKISADLKGLALTRAASVGDSELVILLLRSSADVNYKSAEGRTVLMDAAAYGFFSQCGNDPLVTSYPGNTEIVRALLNAGARVDAQDNNGYTALMLAVTQGRSASVALLLKAGANVNLKNNYGETALTLARDHAAIKQLLISAGALE
jgi:ankyrin repeat protein